MRIAVFDYKVHLNNPAGSCHWQMLRALCKEHQFTVFATEFDNPCPERIDFVRVRVPKRPLFLLFVAFHLAAPVYYFLYRMRRRVKFDLVQYIECNFSFGDVAYSHFCHRSFLKLSRSGGKPDLRQRARYLDNWLHARVEPWVYDRVRRIVVPSRGLARELASEYPGTAGKITVLANPVDLDRMQRPGDFDASAYRAGHGLGADDFVLVFVALGQFDRKGLPQLLEAMRKVNRPGVKLVVVGGLPDVTAQYATRAEQMGLRQSVKFAGMQKDVRPFLWSADAFILPSMYEVFPLVALEAAAAGVPLISTPLNGVEEFLVNSENGYLIQRDPESIAAAILDFVSKTPEQRRQIGLRAAQSVRGYGLSSFVDRWREVYAA